MDIPAFELKEFLSEYCTLAFPERQVLRTDYFCHRQTKNGQWAFILKDDEKHLLTDDTGKVLGQYDRITPLFVPPEKGQISWFVDDLLEQLTGLRSRVQPKDYNTAKDALTALAQPSQPMVAAYLVELKGQLGIVDPQGQVLVPVKYGRIDTFAFSLPGEASLFLCQPEGHELNSLDVYDMGGNGVFMKIANLRPREETLLTPADADIPVKKLKSLWIIRQTIDYPFPEDPEFQLVQEQTQRVTLKQLRCTHSGDPGIQERSLWQHRNEETPPQDALLPLADIVARNAGCSTEELMEHLPHYRTFRRNRLPMAVRLSHVTPKTPLDQLGLGTRAHYCLVGSGLQTAADLAALSDEELPRLRRSTPEILEEIRLLKVHLDEHSRSWKFNSTEQ